MDKELDLYTLIGLLCDARQLLIDESLRLDEQAHAVESGVLQRSLKRQADSYRRKADEAFRIKAGLELEARQALIAG